MFRILVDGQQRFEAGPLSDSDPARAVRVSVRGAQELRLVAEDAGDGIACDAVNWADLRLVRDPSAPHIGSLTIAFNGKPVPPMSSDVCG